jgi:hypothetical protein
MSTSGLGSPGCPFSLPSASLPSHPLFRALCAVRWALKSRGLDATGKQPKCVKRLQEIFSVGASGAVLEQWICVSCPERNCVTCGSGLRAPGHDCKEAECAQAHLAVAELDKAFKVPGSSLSLASRLHYRQKPTFWNSPFLARIASHNFPTNFGSSRVVCCGFAFSFVCLTCESKPFVTC